MKKLLKAVKFVAIGLFALAVTGCSTTNHKSVAEWQGKVWRGVVSKTLVDSTEFRPTDKEWIESTKYDVNRDIGIRMARVHFASGWDSVIANAMVPDNVEFENIPKGTLVDMMAETGPDMDYSTQRFTRIVSVVCAVKDDVCMEREKAAKRIGAVIDNAPHDINSQYGVTYNRRETKEDVKKYD
jgi:hypothetical protein